MHCILEILTTQEEQGIGKIYGPITDLADARNSARDLCQLAHHDHPGCQLNEVDPDELEGDDDYLCGFEIYDPESDLILALYVVKEMFAVALPVEN